MIKLLSLSLIALLLLSACGYSTPPGGGGLTPLVVIVTPTGAASIPTVALTPTPEPTIIPTVEVITATATPVVKVTPTLGTSNNEYTVQKGDTLLGISIRLKVDYEQLVELNDITDPDKLRIDQVLKLPPPKPTPTPES